MNAGSVEKILEFEGDEGRRNDHELLHTNVSYKNFISLTPISKDNPLVPAQLTSQCLVRPWVVGLRLMKFMITSLKEERHSFTEVILTRIGE